MDLMNFLDSSAGVVLQAFQEFTWFMAGSSVARDLYVSIAQSFQNIPKLYNNFDLQWHDAFVHFCFCSADLLGWMPCFKVWMVMWWAAVRRSRPSQLIWSPAGELDRPPTRNRSWQRAANSRDDLCCLLQEAAKNDARSSRSVLNGLWGFRVRSMMQRLARSGLRNWSGPLLAPLGCFYDLLCCAHAPGWVPWSTTPRHVGHGGHVGRCTGWTRWTRVTKVTTPASAPMASGLEALACNSVPALCSLYNSRVRQPGSGSRKGSALKMMKGVERWDGRFMEVPGVKMSENSGFRIILEEGTGVVCL